MKKEYKTMTMEVVSLNAPNLLIVSNRDVLVDDNPNSGQMNASEFGFDSDFDFDLDDEAAW
jgi:hypothetical protein